MKALWKKAVLVLSTTSIVAGCTSVVVKKDPGDHNKGFRYYMPKPYLLLSPSTTTVAEEGTSKKATTTKPVVLELKYLPDYEEKYSVRLRPGIGKGKLEIELQDGWNLTKVGLETDQQIDELVAASGELLSAVGGLAGVGAGQPPGEGKTHLYAMSNVPFGYYEPVFAKTAHGRKIAAWKYIGFLPYGGCPAEVYEDGRAIPSSNLPLYGLGVAEGGVPIFRPLPEMTQPVTPVAILPVTPPKVKNEGGTPKAEPIRPGSGVFEDGEKQAIGAPPSMEPGPFNVPSREQ